ncbi:MAG: CocE/NonD family hydrolase, partial [Gemmatimonadales bacterium]
MPTFRAPHLVVLLGIMVTARPVQAQAPAYGCHFVEIPTRDGVHLHTSICEPRAPHPPMPFLLTRTPYGVAGDTVVRDDYRFFAADGYIFVSQDIRGRFGSE